MNRLPELAALSATAAIAVGVTSAVQGSNNNQDPLGKLASTPTEKLVNADCAQTPLAYNQYTNVLQGTGIVEPLSAKLGPNGYEFNSNDPNVTAAEAARNVSRNTAALAIVWTLINQANTNITVVNAVEDSQTTLNTLANNDAKRLDVCKRVVRGFLVAPHQYDYQSPTSKILTYEPKYDGSKTLNGLNGETSAQAGSTPGINIDVVAGTNNQPLQLSISHEWAITPQGNIIQTAYNLGTAKASKTGTPTKVTTKNGTPVSSTSKNFSSSVNGSTQSTGTGFQNGAGGNSTMGKNKQNQQGFAPGQKPEGQPNKKHFSPGGGSKNTTPTVVQSPPVSRQPVVTQTTTETTPAVTQTNTNTTPTETQPPTTTTTTTTTQPSKGSNGCDPNVYKC